MFASFFHRLHRFVFVTVLKGSMKPLIKSVAAPCARYTLPLPWRMSIVEWCRRRHVHYHCFLTMELLRDFAESDPNAFHRFLWAHHLAYAESYEPSRFGCDKMESSRLLLFEDIQARLRSRGIEPGRDIRSVFDLGCSLGYVLNYAETQVFQSATILRGMDVDAYAIEKGTAFLRRIGSKAEIVTGDAKDLEHVMGKQKFDIVLCFGVLLYFDRPASVSIMRTLLQHTNVMLGVICLAHPNIDNSELKDSVVRESDHGFIHNIDMVIREAGGRVLSHRWMGNEILKDQSQPYFALAEPNVTGK
jgi:SAM-dependent methyltransferase